MKVRFIDYKKDYLRFQKGYDKVWRSVNMRGDLILRKDVEEFEERLADYVGTKYAVSTCCGTHAIYLALKALHVENDQIFVPCHTFKSTCSAVLDAGAKPVIYDLGTVPSGLEYGIVAHIAGEKYPLPKTMVVIEDACQALGAIKNPKTAVQCWSFYPAKLLGCKGDAGALTTNRKDIYEYTKEARNHFKNNNQDFGSNYRMDNLQAALLNVKIQHIDEILFRRKQIARMYLAELKGVGLPNNQRGRIWQDFVIYTPLRNELYEYLKKEGVETMKNEYPFSPEYPKLPNAEQYEANTLRIPNNENLTDKEVNYVIKKINEFTI